MGFVRRICGASWRPSTAPRVEEFDEIVGKPRAQARAAGMTPADVATALRESRTKR